MRFEIRAGGLIFILLCLGGLSAAVFVFGLIAGHEMARQEQVAQEAAAVYPLPSAPAAIATAAAVPQASAVVADRPAPSSKPASAALAGSSSGSGLAPKHGATVALKSSSSPESGGDSAEESSEDESSDLEAAPAPTPAVTHKNYSVQIEAVMDQQGANDMVAKLKRMGYSPYTVETKIGGQTWYRIRVGPYPTPEEAKAVETKLHQEYGRRLTH